MAKLDIELKKIVIRNDAIMGKQSMSLREAKLIRLLIMQINKRDVELAEYQVDIVDIAKVLNIDSSNLYREIRDVCDSLTTRRLGIKTQDPKQPWKFYPWLSMAEYDGYGTITIGLNEKIKGFVLELNKLFTQYEMVDILAINSFYAIRIYEILKKDYTACRKNKNKFEYSIQELRELTDTEKKYSTIGAFRQNIIEIAKREINEKTDLLINIEPIKKSRKYIGFRFFVNEKIKKSEISPSVDKNIKMITEAPISEQINLVDICKIKKLLDDKSIPCTIEQAEQLFLAYKSEITEPFLNNLDYVAKNKRIANRVGYLLKIAGKNIAKESDKPTTNLKSKNKPQKKNHLSESRTQAYIEIDKENQFAENLWAELGCDEIEDSVDLSLYEQAVQEHK